MGCNKILSWSIGLSHAEDIDIPLQDSRRARGGLMPVNASSPVTNLQLIYDRKIAEQLPI
jgi:hypothetical protein